MGKLAGTLFVFNGHKFDYCFMEAIKCLIEFCDYVIVVAGGDDGTYENVCTLSGENIKIIKITQEEWDAHHGKEKLSYFTNIAIQEADRMGFEYQFNLQADEIVHEKSYGEIRKAVGLGANAYFCTRINLWESPYLKLNVPQERKPCSTEIVRLAKVCYRSYDDAENIAAHDPDVYFLNGIRIYHMGFVRKQEVMKSKIINMQCNVFGMADYDKKLDQSDTFNPKLWFDGDDLEVIDEPLPKIIQEWAKQRVYEY